MKKIVIALFVVMVLLLLNSRQEQIIIPSDAIRFRIIANSNNIKDQEEKIKLKKDLEPVLGSILSSSYTKEDTINNINNNMNEIKKTIEKHNLDYNINFGLNYFPEKTYKGLKYSSGNYESLVVTLGDGLGDNWWCVLFPPLCLIEAEEENYDEYTYTSYIKELLDK